MASAYLNSLKAGFDPKKGDKKAKIGGAGKRPVLNQNPSKREGGKMNFGGK